MQQRVNNLIVRGAQVTAILIFLLSVAGYLGELNKYLELTSHFKFQYLLVSLVCLLIFICWRARSSWIYWALFCAVFNGAALVPWYLPAKQVETSQPPIKLLLSNVNYGNGLHQALIDLVRQEKPDVFIAQEVNDRWLSQLKVLGDMYPFMKAAPRARGDGIVFFSRLPVEHAEIVYLGTHERPGVFAKLKVGEKTLSLVTIHPHAPILEDDFRYRNHELAVTSTFVQGLPEPRIVVGDLNITMWSPFLSRFMREANLINARKGFGPEPSWPTHLPSFMRIPIDHCLVSPDLKVVNFRTGKNINSDHLPIIVEISVP